MYTHKFIHTTDGVSEYAIDEVSGEMFSYEITPCSEVEQCGSIDRHYTKARDIEELFDIVSRYKEKRYGEVSYFLNKESLGRWYVPILKLCSKVAYFNVGFYDRKDVADILGVQLSSLNKTLNKLVALSLLSYSGKGLSVKNQIRIVWNPFSVWKGWLGSNTRNVAIQGWYKSLFTVALSDDYLQPSSDIRGKFVIEYGEDIRAYPSPDPYVSGWFNMLPKDKFNELMVLSDAEFELYLLEGNSF